jgi:GNAT superfamily N-acetyltransferase
MKKFTEHKDLHIGPYEPGEEESILDCMYDCFGWKLELAAWRRLFVENPAGPAIIVVARHRSVIVSHFAFLPSQLLAFGSRCIAGRSTWTMTRPEWRRKGIIATLSAGAIEIARQRGFSVFYGFPNNRAIREALKYQGRRVVGPLPLMVRPVRLFRTTFSMLWNRISKGRRIHAMEFIPDSWTKPSFGNRHTMLFMEADAIPPISGIRDSAYLTWRYNFGEDSPYIQQDICTLDSVDATLLLRTPSELSAGLALVMEWIWRPHRREEALRLMREAIRLACSANAYGVAARAMPGTIQWKLLRRLGFISLPHALLPEPMRYLTLGDSLTQ